MKISLLERLKEVQQRVLILAENDKYIKEKMHYKGDNI